VVLALVATGCDGGGGTAAGPVLATPGPAHSVSTDRAADTVDLVSGATTLSVRSADLPGRGTVTATTPDGSGLVPALSVDGSTVSVHVTKAGPTGPDALTVLLDRDVRWRVRVSAGATSQTVDLRDGRLAGLDLLGGATRIDLRLPAPTGTVPVRMAGGATELAVHVPAGVPTGVRVGGGAGTVVLDGETRTGVAGGTVVSTAAATDRYEVDAVAGVSTLVLDRT
jgi:hypothetical protein